MNDSAPLSVMLCKYVTGGGVFPFFLLFSYFFLKKPISASGSDAFPIGVIGPT
jgi:hypothetical protein